MPELLAAIDALVQEHRRCGELVGGVEGNMVWMSSDCGAGLAQNTALSTGPLPTDPRAGL